MVSTRSSAKKGQEDKRPDQPGDEGGSDQNGPKRVKQDEESEEATAETNKDEAGSGQDHEMLDPSSSEEAASVQDLKSKFKQLEEAVTQSEPRMANNVLRALSSTRKRLTAGVLAQVTQESFANDAAERAELLRLSQAGVGTMDVDAKVDGKGSVPEVEFYIYLLYLVFLLDQNRLDEGKSLADEVVDKLASVSRRTMDLIAAKIFFYYSRFHELTGTLDSIRGQLLRAHKLATLRYDTESQAMLLTLLTRNLISYSLYDQADKLISKAQFPASASNTLAVRYQYYLGRVKAIQLDYSGSHDLLLSALRKAPHVRAAAGFIQQVTKLNIIVDLLMGDIPERAIFREPMLEKSLLPYKDIVQAVRVGDLALFSESLRRHSKVFKADSNYSLISRLRHSVIKTGIRMISLSYSKISMRDVCLRLSLESEESAEYIVGKAIRDGVIDASLDHERGIVQSKELLDVYSTTEPHTAFHERIRFCLDLHNDSVKAMRFPLHAHKRELENIEEARRRMEKEIAEVDLDDEDLDADGEF